MLLFHGSFVILGLAASLAACAHKGAADSTTARVDNGSRQLVFKIVQRDPTPAIVSKLINVMKSRLAAPPLRADVFASPDGRLRATIFEGDRAWYAAKLLSTIGTVVLRIQPRGPEYYSPSGRPFRGAAVSSDMTGEPQLLLASSDAASMERFTRPHVGHYLGIYFDGRLIQTSFLQGPISDVAEVHGYSANEKQSRANEAQYHFMATVIDSGPLPVRATPLSSSALTSL